MNIDRLDGMYRQCAATNRAMYVKYDPDTGHWTGTIDQMKQDEDGHEVWNEAFRVTKSNFSPVLAELHKYLFGGSPDGY